MHWFVAQVAAMAIASLSWEAGSQPRFPVWAGRNSIPPAITVTSEGLLTGATGREPPQESQCGLVGVLTSVSSSARSMPTPDSHVLTHFIGTAVSGIG